MTTPNGTARRMLEKAFWVMITAIMTGAFFVGGMALKQAYANETAIAVTNARYAEILRRLDRIETAMNRRNR